MLVEVWLLEIGGSNLAIDTGFSGISTVINNRTYYLGQQFTNGVAGPEVKNTQEISFMLITDLQLQDHQTKKKILKSFCSSKELCLSKQTSM
jgi:hypothetical protein